MPDDITNTNDQATNDTTAPAYTFPFDVPADLSTLDEGKLRELHIKVKEHAQQFTGIAPNEHTEETLAGLRASAELAKAIKDAMSALADRSNEINAALAALDEDLPETQADAGDDGDGSSEGDGAEENNDGDAATEGDGDAGDGVTASDGDLAARVGAALLRLARDPSLTASRTKAPSVRNIARNGQPQLPADASRGAYASMVAASGVAGFAPGQTLESFSEAAKLLSRQIDQHPSLTASRARGNRNLRPVTVYDGSEGRRFQLLKYSRTPGVELRRDFPQELRVGENDERGYSVAEYAANERRLPGGSLLRSAELQVKRGRALTAAAGWCAPSETIYELCELETLDGILDLPEIQTTRGGWQIPQNGGPDFSTIWSSLGNSGDTHLSEEEVIAEDPAKVCTEIPCPDFDDVRLGVDYYCLTGGLLQRRGYPEVVARFARGAAVALAHKINQGVISAIVAGSGAATVIPADPSGDDAAAALLSAVDLAIVDAKYRNRQGFSETLEVVLPMWVLAQIRAALARRRGVEALDVSDAEILDWFAVRRAMPRFVYDWQDAFSGLGTGPGGATPLTALPTTVQFLVYPAGTWVKAVQDVVSLDTIYDSTLLQTNQYTAIFAEDGWAVLQMCPLSRLYTVSVDPSGVVGCCPSGGSGS